MTTKKNAQIRAAFKAAGVRLAFVADGLGVSRQTFDYLLDRGPTETERRQLLRVLRRSQKMLSYIEREIA